MGPNQIDFFVAFRQFGKTAPEHFRIDFFASDEKNQKASTFDHLCTLEYNELGLTTAYPKLPFVTKKLVVCGRYQVLTLAVFGAEATNSDAIRLIHQRRSETNSAGSGLLPTPDAFHKNVDNVRNPPLGHNQSSIGVSSAYQSYHSSINKSGPGYAFDSNDYQSNNYEKREYNRIRENTKESFYEKPPLLPTPTIGNKDHLISQDNSKRYQHSGSHYQQDNDNNFQSSNTTWSRENYRNYTDENAYSGESDEKKSDSYASKQQVFLFDPFFFSASITNFK